MQTLTYTLNNGMQVVLRLGGRAPVVSMAILVRVGSADEEAGEHGLAHVHEHMLFKGTQRRGVGEIARAIEAHGGNINAYTSFDETVYYATLSSRFFEEGLDILSDAVQNPLFDPEELDRELEVILEEISRGEDDPGHEMMETLFALTYGEHPYGRPVIGTRDSVKALDRDAVLGFFSRWYVPSNMTLVITGDISPQRARAAIDAHFGPSDAPAPVRASIQAPAPPQPQAALQVGEVNEVYLAAAFQIPEACHSDGPALDLLRVLYSYGEASLLVERLDRQLEWVNYVSAGVYMPRQPGLFYVMGSYIPSPDHPGPEAVLEQIMDVVTAPAREPVRQEDLNRARGLLESSRVYQEQTVEGQARALVHYAACPRGLGYETEYYEELAQITPEMLAEVARRTFDPQKMALVAYGEAQALEAMDKDSLLEAARRGLQGQPQLPGPRGHQVLERDEHGLIRLVIPQGPTLLFQEDDTAALVSLRAVFLGGQLKETQHTAGLHSLLGSIWASSTASRTYQEMAREVETLGAALDGTSGRNTVGMQLDALSAHLSGSLALLADTLRNPSFDPEELDREKRLTLEDWMVQRDSPGRVASRMLHRALFGQHPYALDISGNPHSLEHLDRDLLVDHYRQHIQPDQMVLCAVGDLRAESMVPELLERLAAQPWLGGPPEQPALLPEPSPQPSLQRRVWTTQLPRQQAQVLLAYPGLRLTDPQVETLEVLIAILSGQGGRLFLELRDRQSLAYSVQAYSMSGLDPGYLALHIATAPEKIQAAVEGLQSQAERLTQEIPDQGELDRARLYLLGNHDIHLQRYGARAFTMALHEIYGLGHDHHLRYPERIKAVTAQDVTDLARELFVPEHAQLIAVRPEGTQLPDLSPQGFSDIQQLSVEQALGAQI